MNISKFNIMVFCFVYVVQWVAGNLSDNAVTAACGLLVCGLPSYVFVASQHNPSVHSLFHT